MAHTNAVTITSLFDNDALPENLPNGTVIAELALAEPVSGDVRYTVYSTIRDVIEWTWPDKSFEIIGNLIVTPKPFDFEMMKIFNRVIDITIYAHVTSEDFTYRGELTLEVSDVQETIRGTSKDDRLVGSVGADKFLAGAGDDKLYGKDGDDVFYGALGQDVLSGGAGANTFLFKSIKESTVKAPDIIVTWNHVAGYALRDVIDLRTIDANTKAAGNQAFDWIGKKGFSGQAGELRYEVKGVHTYVYADVNGDRKADFAIQMQQSNLKMYADDFLL